MGVIYIITYYRNMKVIPPAVEYSVVLHELHQLIT